MSHAQQEAVRTHRQRMKCRGVTRVELQTPREDAPLLREIARVLRGDPEQAARVRAQLARAIHPEPGPGLKQLLAAAPLEGIELTRQRDAGREIDL